MSLNALEFSSTYLYEREKRDKLKNRTKRMENLQALNNEKQMIKNI